MAAREKSAEVTDPLRRPGQWQSQSRSDELEVTQPIPPRAQRAPAPPAHPPAPVSKAPAPGASPEGDFTRLFRRPAPAGTPPAAATPTPPAARPEGPPPQAQEPGEFTRVFLSGPAPGSTKPPAPAPPPNEPGEFTRFSCRPASPPPNLPRLQRDALQRAGRVHTDFPASRRACLKPAAAPAKPPASEPGEFTRIFQNPGALQKSAQPTPPQKPAGPQKADPGEFTRIFQNPGAPQKPAQPMPPPKPAAPQKTDPGEFTKFFQSPLATPTPATPSDDYFSKPAAKAPAPPAAGDFTQIFGKPGALSEPPAAQRSHGFFQRSSCAGACSGTQRIYAHVRHATAAARARCNPPCPRTPAAGGGEAEIGSAADFDPGVAGRAGVDSGVRLHSQMIARTSLRLREQHDQLDLRIREIPGNIGGEIPGPH